MTPSEKPESSASHPQQDAEQTSVITQTVEGTAEKTSAQHDDEGTAASTNQEQDASRKTSEGGTDEAELHGTDSPPPWQRASVKSPDEAGGSDEVGSVGGSPFGTVGTAAGGSSPDAEDTQTIPRPVSEPGFPASDPVDGDSSSTARAGRTSASYAGGSAARSGTSTSARRPSRGPRRASLQLKRLDPWSVLKLALVLSVALFFVWMIAVAVLYGVLDGMGVWDQLNGTFTELTQSDDAAGEQLISAGRVFGVASIVGAINIVLITALATVAAFIYNVAADFAGGIEVTLSERE